MARTLVSLVERPDLEPLIESAEAEGFPHFLLQDPVFDALFGPAMAQAPDLQVFLLDDDGEVLGLANGIAISWDGTVEDLPDGTHGALRRSAERPGRDALCMIQAVMLGAGRGGGLSAELMQRWAGAAHAMGLQVISPIRASLKHLYPVTDFSDYVNWTREGEAFDPWIRMQARLGAVRGPVCDDALVISAPVASWEEWTGLAMPGPGDFIVDGGQVPVRVDADSGIGTYAESHIWFTYPEERS